MVKISQHNNLSDNSSAWENHLVTSPQVSTHLPRAHHQIIVIRVSMLLHVKIIIYIAKANVLESQVSNVSKETTAIKSMMPVRLLPAAQNLILRAISFTTAIIYLGNGMYQN